MLGRLRFVSLLEILQHCCAFLLALGASAFASNLCQIFRYVHLLDMVNGFAKVSSMNSSLTFYRTLQRTAHQIVKAALRNGVIKRQKCEHCDKLGDAHHEDYTKPLEIMWLCRSHHHKRHAVIGKVYDNVKLPERQIRPITPPKPKADPLTIMQLRYNAEIATLLSIRR